MTIKNIRPEWTRNRGHVKYQSEINEQLYNRHRIMISQCYGNNALYHRIGGMGISVCNKWINPKDGFKNFVSDMSKTFKNNSSKDNMTLIRKDLSKDFNKENCGWMTRSESRKHNIENQLYTEVYKDKNDYDKRYCEVCNKEINKPYYLSHKRYKTRRFCSQACHWGRPFVIPEGREGMYKKVVTNKHNETYYTKDSVENRNKSIKNFTDALESIIKKGDVPIDVLNRTKEVLKQFSGEENDNYYCKPRDLSGNLKIV